MVCFMRLSKPFFIFKALIFVAGLSLFLFCVFFFVFSLLRPFHGLLLRCSRAFQGDV